jgi:hypothetical protein
MYYIDIVYHMHYHYIMPYSLKADNHVICQCGCIVKKYYMPKHLQTAKHERERQGRENIEVVEHYIYKPRNN